MALILNRVQNVSKRLAASRINAMQPVHKIKPDGSGLDPGIQQASPKSLDCRIKFGNEPEFDKCWCRPNVKTPRAFR